ncbi:pyruvate synthase subunit beta [Nanoarchaeota archaeon]|nr:MAG: pyruvate synthase subunit beta [Nanoarchaeota archaeon]
MIAGLPEEEYLAPGHKACAGCPEAIIARLVTKAAGPNTVIVNSTSCLEVVSSQYPHNAWKLPWIHNAFENAAPTASGIAAAFKKLGKDTNILVFMGDGAAYDIGFGALSGMFERRDPVTVVVLNNEAYMNTGIQRSSATEYGAWTTTTPVGSIIKGKRRWPKPLTDIAAAHGIPYVANASPAYAQDLFSKVKKGLQKKPSLINVIAPCPVGWKFDPSLTIHVARLAVETGAWVLYEVDEGQFKITVDVQERKPVSEYLKVQGRFKHLSDDDVRTIQERIDKAWESYKTN